MVVLRAFRLGLALVAVAVLVLLAPGVTRGNVTYTVQVPGDPPLTDTGIYLAAGSQLHITATGLIKFDSTFYSDPDGNSDWPFGRPKGNFLFLIQGIPILSLVGCVGETPPVVNSGLAYPGYPAEAWTNLDLASTHLLGDGYIGSNFTGTSPYSGFLYLGYNDRWCPGNSGYFTAQVEVGPPVPAPSSLWLAMVGIGLCVSVPLAHRFLGRRKALLPTGGLRV